MMKINRPQKIHINRQRFLKTLEEKGSSIAKLGSCYLEIGRTERTIRRCINSKQGMPAELLDSIAKYLNVYPDLLSGKLDDLA